MKNESFTFGVLAFNHERYILEHLESIKYLVVKYGGMVDVSLIISDDCSKDKTVDLIDLWLSKNSNLFSNVITIYNEKNLGTCSSFKNIAKELATNHAKITAGDDVYNDVNIFDFIYSHNAYSLLTGIPVRLIDGKVYVSFYEIFNFFASNEIYKNCSLIDRLSDLSIINAPNVVYASKYLKNDNIINFLKDFDVVEDLPFQISIAVSDPSAQIRATNIPLVLYRRTAGSTYLTEESRFYKDQIDIFDYLISFHNNKGNKIKALLLTNRRFLFCKRNRLLSSVANVSKYLFILGILTHCFDVLRSYLKFKPKLHSYQKHYELISSLANEFYNDN